MLTGLRIITNISLLSSYPKFAYKKNEYNYAKRTLRWPLSHSNMANRKYEEGVVTSSGIQCWSIVFPLEFHERYPSYHLYLFFFCCEIKKYWIYYRIFIFTPFPKIHFFQVFNLVFIQVFPRQQLTVIDSWKWDDLYRNDYL